MKDLAEFFGHTFYRPGLGPDSVVVDLGASSGGFAHAVAELTGCRCHCVEAAPDNVLVIEQTDRISRHHYAIGGIDGPVTVHVADEEFHWVGTEAIAGAGEAIEVPGVTLPTLLTELGLCDVDLLKVDIEGAEIAMFDAAPDDVLRRMRQISIEFHDFIDPRQGPDVARIIKRLEGLGFDAVVFTRRFHGDVLFLNRPALGIGKARLLLYRSLVKWSRGIGRMWARVGGERR